MTVAAAYSYWPTADATNASAAGTASKSADASDYSAYWPVSTDGTADGTKSGIWKEAGGASFHDLLDTVNPLQHLPVVATVYRWLTGDEPGNLARIAGDALYGGPVGAVSGLFSAISRDGDGEDMGERIMTWAFGPGHAKSEPDPATAVAANNNDAATSSAVNGGGHAPAPVTAAALPAPAKSTAASDVPSAGSPRSLASVAALYQMTAPKPAAPSSTSVAAAGTTTELAAATAPAKTTAAASAEPSAGSSRSVASVAALYRATDPAARGASVAAAKPDHPPMPLVRPGAAMSVASAAADAPAHQLSAENAMLQRQISAGRSPAAPGTPQLVNTPVPLQLTGQALPVVHPRVYATAPQASRPAAATAATAEAAAPAPANDSAKTPLAPAAPTDLASGSPAEISQKMMAALDKYMKLQQQQKAAAAAAAGGKVDVSP